MGGSENSNPLSGNDQWEVCIGSVLDAVQRRAHDEVTNGLYHARSAILNILPAISSESYVRAYPHVVKLHMLQEMEDALCVMQTVRAISKVSTVQLPCIILSCALISSFAMLLYC